MQAQESLTSEKEDIWKLWKLRSEKGRQRWFLDQKELENLCDSEKAALDKVSKAFTFDKTKNPNSADLVYRLGSIDNHDDQLEIPDWLGKSTDFSSSLEKKATHAAFRGIKFYEQLQAEDGHWPGDYGGPLFLLPGLIIASYVTDTPFDPVKQTLMARYMLNHQNEDGGWGLHIEGQSTMFGTVMQYCALRLLGAPADSEELEKGRAWILENGGASGIPSWGKFFLSLLGVYSWEGCNSLMPEMWLLPKWLPIHPWRYWCHARMVYLPMSYCYGHKITAETNDLIKSIRSEIYTNYDSINWSKKRNKVAPTDSFFKTSPLLKRLFSIINLYENVAIAFFRQKSLKFVLEYVEAEDEQTKDIDIGPVNQIINSICIWHAYGKDSSQFKKHVDRWDDYLWLAEDGLKMNGYNGSQLWDTAFATQALLANPPELVNHETIIRAYDYIDYSQIKEEVSNRKRYFRHQSVGGWPFSTLDHGWPISDCTAEGIKATLDIHRSEFFSDVSSRAISNDRLRNAVDIILSFQNKDGGWATYENTRSSPSIEFLNPSEVFGNIMIDYSWVECSSACVTALISFQAQDDTYRSREIDIAVESGIRFLINEQKADGSWIGSWGVCFTYGTWFGMEALAAYGKNSKEKQDRVKHHLQKAVEFLLSKQNDDGGWGETYESCVKSEYVNGPSQVVNTSWALLGLMATDQNNLKSINRGIQYLTNQQKTNGDWAQEGVSGVFNQNCMITYTAYRNVFPIWSLGRYLEKHSKTLNYRGVDGNDA